MGHQQQQHLRPCWQCKFVGPTPDLPKQKVCGGASCSVPDDSHARSRVTAPGLRYFFADGDLKKAAEVPRKGSSCPRRAE